MLYFPQQNFTKADVYQSCPSKSSDFSLHQNNLLVVYYLRVYTAVTKNIKQLLKQNKNFVPPLGYKSKLVDDQGII